ncbi:hypothetical protein QBC44DRAFT_243684 [Cladorrhinum sp. PSN332]|nr:hypothetical protein QBC44DRAFT_243684 [Cladorrhinum sp. PSN332]
MACFSSPDSSPTTASTRETGTLGVNSFLGAGLFYDPGNDGTGVETQAAVEKPLVPTSAADWEAKKDIIQQLYMERNIILNDVIDIMIKEHRFKATARMYKGQFSKWKWTKYNKSGNTSTIKSAKSRVGKKRGSASTGSNTARHDLRATKAVREFDLDLNHNPNVLQQQQQLQQQQYIFHPQILQLDSDNFKFENSLSAYKALVAHWSGPEHESPWRIIASDPTSLSLSSPFPAPLSTPPENCILQQVRMALNHFRSDRPTQAGETLRQAFLGIESAICSPQANLNVQVIWDCCLAVPQLTLSLNFPDVLECFTRHVKNVAAIKLSRHHPVTQICQTLSELARAITTTTTCNKHDNGNAFHHQHHQVDAAKFHLDKYILSGWNFWLDLASSQRGRQDHVTIHLRRGYAVLVEDFPPQPLVAHPLPDMIGDRPRAGSNFMADFESSLTRSFKVRGMVRTTARILELEDLLVRMYLPLFTPRKAERAKILLDNIVERNLGRGGRDWDPEVISSFHGRYLVFSARYFMASIADYMGEHERARDMRRLSLDMDMDTDMAGGELKEKERDLFWMQTALMVVQGLRGEGKDEEAEVIEEEMRRCGWAGVRILNRVGEEGGELVPRVKAGFGGRDWMKGIVELNDSSQEEEEEEKEHIDDDDDDDDNIGDLDASC